MGEGMKSGGMRVRSKLLLGLLAIVMLMAAVGWIVIRQQTVIEDCFALLERTNTVKRYLLECRRQEKNFFLRHDETSLNLFTAHHDSLFQNVSSLRRETLEPGLASKLSLLEQRVAEYGQTFREAASAWSENPDHETLAALEGLTVPRARACHSLVDEIGGTSFDAFCNAHRMTRAVSLISVGLGLLLSILIAGILTRHIVNPLEHIRRLAERVSTGDMQDMDVEFTELDMKPFNSRETYDLAMSLRRMITSMRLLISSEQGMMDDYHMTIMVLVNRAVGPAGRSLIEEARAAAGFEAFAEVNPSNVNGFLFELGKRAVMLIPKERVDLLSDAIKKLGQAPGSGPRTAG